MSTAVVIPYSGGDGHRAAALTFVRKRLERDFDDMVIAPPPDGEWNKAAAVNAGLRLTDADVLVIHDGDVTIGIGALDEAIAAVCDGEADWAIPHRLVHRLTEAATADYLDGKPVAGNAAYDRAPYVGVAGGGVVVLRRETYLDCPLDPRFVGWGSEDESWGVALATLHGEPWRGCDGLTHLWHPHAAPHQRRSVRPESMRLWRAYRARRGIPENMRALVDSMGDPAARPGRGL